MHARLRQLTLGAFQVATCIPWQVATSQSLRLERVPIVRMPRDAAFESVVGAVVLSDGGFVVGDDVNRRLHFFSPAGAELQRVGRDGAGPGEFRQLAWLGRCGGDSVFAFDPELQRLSVLSPHGRYVRASRITAGDRLPLAVECNTHGTLAVISWPMFRADIAPGPYRGPQTVYLAKTDGRIEAKLGDFAGSERVRSVRGDGPRIFGKQLSVALGTETIFVGEADSLHIAAFDRSGRPKRHVRAATFLDAVTAADVAAYQETHLATVRDPGARRAQAEGFGKYPFPKTFPAYQRLIVDPFNYLWVRRFYQPTSQQDTWTVFSPAGRLVGEVTVPIGAELLAVGHDRIVTRTESVTGSYEILVFSLTRVP